MKKMLFIYNPKAGKAQIKNKLSDILEVFRENGYLVTIYPTGGKGDGTLAAKTLAGQFDRVVCSGGDGTLDEVIAGLKEGGYQIPVGYIPSGSTNDFGNSLRIPRDFIRAAQTAVSGRKFACDIGTFNEKTFIYIAAFGIFTDVSYETKQQMKNLLGHMAYLLEGMKRLSSLKSYSLSFQFGDTRIEGDFIFGMVTNSVSVGGMKRITGKNVVLNDGVFEVTLIKKPANAIELNQIITALLNEDLCADGMYCFRTSYLKVENREKIPWTLDGEYGGNPEVIEIRNQYRAQTILVPEKKHKN